MAKLIIKEIGPINYVELSLNRFNVLIGPQSSGKSIIAKISSLCFWLEKNILLHRNYDHVDHSFIDHQINVFYNLKSYLNNGYSIFFEGDIMQLQYDAQNCIINLKEKFNESRVGKVAYIPAERIAVSLPNISSLKLPENYIRSFIFDWLEIRTKYQQGNLINLLKLNLKYYFEENKGDTIILENGKEIRLDESSSGLQSVVPLYVYIDYLTKWIYENKEDISFDKQELIERAVKKELGADALELKKNLSFSHSSTIIIEEPELNLFPETQKDLVYSLLGMMNADRDRMIITTHSPYLLYALNNCLLGYLAKDNISEDDEELSGMHQSWIDPQNVSVWEIKAGKLAPYMDNNPQLTIQDEKGLIRNNYFDRIMKNIMADFSSLMGYWDED
jgi:Uncharacterized conserved protein